jgi:CBS-domain-containing membrane protein
MPSSDSSSTSSNSSAHLPLPVLTLTPHPPPAPVKSTSLSSGYFSKMTGGQPAPPFSIPPLLDLALALIGAFVGIGGLFAVTDHVTNPHSIVLFMASFGASAVLVFGVPHGPLSQPRHVIGGNLVGAFFGCCFKQISGTGPPEWWQAALAMSLSLTAMQVLNVVHPPGGATAIVALTAKWQRGSHFLFMVTPTLVGSIFLVLVGVIVTNISPRKRYPQFW